MYTELTPHEIMMACPASKRSCILDCWEDTDGVWVMLNQEWECAEDHAHTISLNGAAQDEPKAARIKELRKEFAGVNRV